MNISIDKKFFLLLSICFLIYFQGILNLPVLDRDEARFATASKTMLLNKDFIDIKMVDEERYKKPIGIYWSQSITNFILGDPPYDKIWIYRLPSFFGIFLCFIFIFFSLKRFETPETSFLTIFFLAFSILTISEIHQAKTDGLLFLFISICNLIIYDVVNKKKNNYIYLFWICLSVGILIKGPIIIIFTFFPLLAFSICKRKSFFSYFWSLKAFVIFLIIVIPWFVLISLKSEGAFWNESVGNDLFNKVKSGQESHGFPPGYYSILVFLFFWPGSMFLINTVKSIKLNFKSIFKNDDYTFYLIISFIIPFIFFEIIPTKLPHYVFPAYLPLSILISRRITEINFEKNLLNFAIIPMIIFPLSIIGIIIFAVLEYSLIDNLLIFNISLLSLIFSSLIWLIRKRKVKPLIYTSGLFQITTILIVVFFLTPRLEKLWISEKINNIIEKNRDFVDQTFTLGFNEPSLLFLTSHKVKNNNFDDLTVENIKNKKVMFIVTEAFSKNIEEMKDYNSFTIVEEFTGFNYSKGKEIRIKVYKN